LDTVGSEALPPVITLTDSFGSFGKKSSNSNPSTCSTEFTAIMDGRANPWNIKPYPGEGIGAFVKHLSNFSRIAIEEPKDTEPFSAANWPPVMARPTNPSVVVIGWFGNELCDETYVNSLGQTVPKLPAGKKWRKGEDKPIQALTYADPPVNFEQQVQKLIRILSYYKYPVVVGAGSGEFWNILEPERWDAGVDRTMQLFRDAGILVLDPKAYISSHERRDAMHPKDTPSNKSLQAKLFFHAAAAARAFGRIKEIRLGLLSAPHSFEAWPDAEATTVGGDSDSNVRGLINEIEKMMLSVLKKNATSFMNSENVARASRRRYPFPA
jgi:hypothetical protein